MPCVLSSVYFRNTLVFSLLFLSACGTESLHPRKSHVIVTRIETEPFCKSLGSVSLREIKTRELSPLEPMSRSTLEEIHEEALRTGANYVIVRPGPLGPQAANYVCG